MFEPVVKERQTTSKYYDMEGEEQKNAGPESLQVRKSCQESTGWPNARAKAYTYILDKIDHPDNLYLTCRSCNSSLGDTFPDKSSRDEIVKSGTLGDWLRKDESEIRKS